MALARDHRYAQNAGGTALSNRTQSVCTARRATRQAPFRYLRVVGTLWHSHRFEYRPIPCAIRAVRLHARPSCSCRVTLSINRGGSYSGNRLSLLTKYAAHVLLGRMRNSSQQNMRIQAKRLYQKVFAALPKHCFIKAIWNPTHRPAAGLCQRPEAVPIQGTDSVY